MRVMFYNYKSQTPNALEGKKIRINEWQRNRKTGPFVLRTNYLVATFNKLTIHP